MTWWKQVPDIHKALAAFVALVVTLFMAGVTFGNLIGVPEKVQSLEHRMTQMEYQQGEILQAIRTTNCYLDNLIEDKNQRCP